MRPPFPIMSTKRRGIMRLFNSFSLVNLFKNILTTNTTDAAAGSLRRNYFYPLNVFTAIIYNFSISPSRRVSWAQYKWCSSVPPSDFLPISSEETGSSDVSQTRIEIRINVCIFSWENSQICSTFSPPPTTIQLK